MLRALSLVDCKSASYDDESLYRGGVTSVVSWAEGKSAVGYRCVSQQSCQSVCSRGIVDWHTCFGAWIALRAQNLKEEHKTPPLPLGTCFWQSRSAVVRAVRAPKRPAIAFVLSCRGTTLQSRHQPWPQPQRAESFCTVLLDVRVSKGRSCTSLSRHVSLVRHGYKLNIHGLAAFQEMHPNAVGFCIM